MEDAPNTLSIIPPLSGFYNESTSAKGDKSWEHDRLVFKTTVVWPGSAVAIGTGTLSAVDRIPPECPERGSKVPHKESSIRGRERCTIHYQKKGSTVGRSQQSDTQWDLLRNVESSASCLGCDGGCIAIFSATMEPGSDGGNLGGVDSFGSLIPTGPIRERMGPCRTAIWMIEMVQSETVICFYSLQTDRGCL